MAMHILTLYQFGPRELRIFTEALIISQLPYADKMIKITQDNPSATSQKPAQPSIFNFPAPLEPGRIRKMNADTQLKLEQFFDEGTIYVRAFRLEDGKILILADNRTGAKSLYYDEATPNNGLSYGSYRKDVSKLLTLLPAPQDFESLKGKLAELTKNNGKEAKQQILAQRDKKHPFGFNADADKEYIKRKEKIEKAITLAKDQVDELNKLLTSGRITYLDSQSVQVIAKPKT